MTFGSLFSGIEAASVAWTPLGWECLPAPSSGKVLALAGRVTK